MSIVFDKSPVNEVIFGIQFSGPIFSVTDMIELFNIYKNDYTHITEHSPLPAIIESVTNQPTQQILNSFCSRKHIIHKNKDKLIQIQPDKIFFNWRKEKDHNEYPHFDKIFEIFTHIIKTIHKRLKNELYDKISQYEMTYIDHIIIKDFSLTNYKPGTIFKLIKDEIEFKDIDFNFSIPYQKIGGVLNSSLKSAVKSDDKEKLFVFENTCRGYEPSLEMNEWFNSAHDILINNFLNIITKQAKKVWCYREE